MITLTANPANGSTQCEVFCPETSWPVLRTPTVVLLEDDEDLALGMSVRLSHLGCEVVVSTNGAEGLEAIESVEPDLVVLDLNLPGMHGFKVMHEMRMRSLLSPVLIVTASSAVEAEARALSLGAVEVMTKPVDPDDLGRTIRELLCDA